MVRSCWRLSLVLVMQQRLPLMVLSPHAADFGYGIMQLGSMAQIGAGIGRSMSPVAGQVSSLRDLQVLTLWKWRNAMLCLVLLRQ